MSAAQNALAKTLKALHRPGSPLIVTNVYDAVSAKTVAALPAAKAIATASFAVAEAAGMSDDKLTRSENVRAAKIISSAIRDFGKPLSVDFQDGYGEELEDGVRQLIEANVVGINLEDYDKEAKRFYDTPEAADRIKRVLSEARKLGVPDFVVNARCDVLVHGGGLEETMVRGRAYLEAGATTVFVWGGSSRGGITRAEVTELVKAFDGHLNVLLDLSNDLSASDLAGIGVARISLGPSLQLKAMESLKQSAEAALKH